MGLRSEHREKSDYDSRLPHDGDHVQEEQSRELLFSPVIYRVCALGSEEAHQL